jgi:hypothetical protein
MMAEAQAKTDTAVETAGLPPSPLSGADPGKHEYAAPAAPAAAETAPKAPETKAEPAAPKPESKPEAKPEPAPEAKKESPAESGDKPPETKPEAKEPPKPETKPEGEKKPEAEVKETAEAKPETKPEPAKEPQAPPTYDKLAIPEGVKLDDSRVAKFDEIVGKAELAAKTDPHAALATFRQDAVNFHIEEIQRVAKAVQDNQINVWNKLVETRVNEIKSDPKLGGNRIETSLGNAKYALENLIPGFSKEQAARWLKVADAGGVSHDLSTIQLLNAIYDVFAEPEPVNDGQPLNAKQTKQAGERGWYDKVDAKATA